MAKGEICALLRLKKINHIDKQTLDEVTVGDNRDSFVDTIKDYWLDKHLFGQL